MIDNVKKMVMLLPDPLLGHNDNMLLHYQNWRPCLLRCFISEIRIWKIVVI